MRNLDEHTAEGFDLIWKLHGSHEGAKRIEAIETFHTYFSIFPVEALAGAEGFDLGCGNGRIAQCIAPRAGFLHCIDPSAAGLAAAREAMRHLDNVSFHQASVDSIPLPESSQDFGFAIGVLHHVPDPAAGLKSCVNKLKRGAPFLLYMYYSLDNRPRWFRLLWRISDIARQLISKLPFELRVVASTITAATIYWPLSRASHLLRALGVSTNNLPLSGYTDRPWADLRADALDRFGTAVEHRFSREQIEKMMVNAGLRNIRFALGPPYWVALGYKT
jgi:SAM-dependent methyltransferase